MELLNVFYFDICEPFKRLGQVDDETREICVSQPMKTAYILKVNHLKLFKVEEHEHTQTVLARLTAYMLLGHVFLLNCFESASVTVWLTAK